MSESGEVIRFLVEQYYDIQKLRVEAFNRIVAYVKSHGASETQMLCASHGFSENHQSSASPTATEIHSRNASQTNSEIQQPRASQRRRVTQSGYASHTKNENHGLPASRTKNENQKPIASHAESEIHEVNASHHGNETQTQLASVKPSVIAHKIIRGTVEVPQDISELVWYHNRLYNTEKELAKRLDSWSSTHPLRINFLSHIQGIGPILSSALIAWLAPVSRFSNISKLWAYAGMSPFHYQCKCEKKHKFLLTHPAATCPVKVGTKRESCKAKIIECVKVNKPIRHKRGYLAFFNPHMKTLMWKVASSFEKQKAEKSFYRRIYQTKKAEYLQRADLKKPIDDKVKGAKLHVRLMSMKFTSKRFLADMWLFWRKLEGLPVTKPYAHTVLGHTNYQPWEPDKP